MRNTIKRFFVEQSQILMIHNDPYGIVGADHMDGITIKERFLINRLL